MALSLFPSSCGKLEAPDKSSGGDLSRESNVLEVGVSHTFGLTPTFLPPPPFPSFKSLQVAWKPYA